MTTEEMLRDKVSALELIVTHLCEVVDALAPQAIRSRWGETGEAMKAVDAWMEEKWTRDIFEEASDAKESLHE